MSKVTAQITLEADSLQELAALLSSAPAKAVSAPAETPKAVSAPAEETSAPAEETKPAEEDKPKRRRRSKAELTASKEEPKAEEPAATELSYETDVKPTLVKLSGQDQQAARDLVKSFGVTNAKDVPVDKLADLLAKAQAALETEEADEDDDFTI